MRYANRVALRLCLLTLIAMSSRPTWAGGTIFGSTGLILNPTADVIAEGRMDFDAATIKERVQAGTTNLVRLSSFTLVGSVQRNLELGLGLQRYKGPDTNPLSDSAVIAAIKFQFQEETDLRPGIALGIERSKALESTSMYAVASSRIHLPGVAGNFTEIYPTRGHLGAKLLKFDTPIGNDKTNLVPFAALEVALSPQMIVSLELEGKHEDRPHTPFALLLRYRLQNNLRLYGGLANTGFGESARFIAGVGYTFTGFSWK